MKRIIFIFLIINGIGCANLNERIADWKKSGSEKVQRMQPHIVPALKTTVALTASLLAINAGGVIFKNAAYRLLTSDLKERMPFAWCACRIAFGLSSIYAGSYLGWDTVPESIKEYAKNQAQQAYSAVMQLQKQSA